MNEFNYKKAWTNLALPAFDILRSDVRALVTATTRNACDLRQDKDLDMPWPADGVLRASFEACPSEVLAPSARIVHDFGHWAPRLEKQLKLSWQQDYLAGLRTAETLQQTGAYWKFSNYADQVLRSRLGLSRTHSPHGVSFAVHEGVLRVCFSARDVWTWTPLTWAFKDAYERVRDVEEPDWFATNRTPGRYEEMFREYADTLAAVAIPPRTFDQITNLTRFMEEAKRR